jgi:hypothetical protein
MNTLSVQFFNLDPTRKCRPLTTPDPRIVGNGKDRNLQFPVRLGNLGEQHVTAGGGRLVARLAPRDAAGAVSEAALSFPADLHFAPGDVQEFKFWPPTVTIPADVPDGVYSLSVAAENAAGEELGIAAIFVRVNDTDLYALADDLIIAPPVDTNAAAALELDANNDQMNELDATISALNVEVSDASKKVESATFKKTALQKRNDVLRGLLALLFLLALSIPALGCMKSSLSMVLKEAKNDPAKWRIRVNTIYGSIDIDREVPTNFLGHYLPDAAWTASKNAPPAAAVADRTGPPAHFDELMDFDWTAKHGTTFYPRGTIRPAPIE